MDYRTWGFVYLGLGPSSTWALSRRTSCPTPRAGTASVYCSNNLRKGAAIAHVLAIYLAHLSNSTDSLPPKISVVTVFVTVKL